MDKITLDFENCTIEWDNDSQKGAEFCPNLAERKANILSAMGYKVLDFSEELDIINRLINSQTDQEREENTQKLIDLAENTE